MLLEEFALPPTIVQYAIQRSPIQANNFELKAMTLHMLQNILFHGLASENPNMHLTNFIEVCDTIKYNAVTEETLRLRLFLLSLADKSATRFHYFMEQLGAKVPEKVLPACKDYTTSARDQYY